MAPASATCTAGSASRKWSCRSCASTRPAPTTPGGWKWTFCALPTKITTGQISLALYQVEPVADKTLARTLSIGVYGLDGTAISEVRTITFDVADEEPRLREKTVGLTLSRAADDYNGQEVEIRLLETIPGTNQTAVYKRHRAKTAQTL